MKNGTEDSIQRDIMTQNKDSSKSPQSPGKTDNRTETTEILEIMEALSDNVTNAVLTCIAETGECSKKELVTLDAVVEETESDVTALKELGLIEVGEDTIALTEKGRKVLAYIKRWNSGEVIP